MVGLASTAAVIAFLLPVMVVVLARLRNDSEPWEVALDVVTAVAVDLLVVLALSFVVRLETATLVARVGWMALGVAAFAKRRRDGHWGWPKFVSARVGVALLVAVVVAVLISTEASRPYSMWDRRWHIPLVASIRGQSLPFHNAMAPTEGLHYHFSGDVHAAMLQALSLNVIHSAFGLSLAHDVHFGLCGLVIGLLLVWWRHRLFLAYALGPAAVLLSGPFTIFREGIRKAQHGYSLINYLSLSFRPHIALSGLLMLGFIVAVVARVRNNDLEVKRTAPALVVITAALAITDEASTGLLGLSLGLAWLIWPGMVHPKRKAGALIFVALAAAVVVPNVVFGASLAPGGQAHTVKLVPWRSPGCYTPVLPFTEARGVELFVYDVLPFVVIFVGMVVLWLAQHRSRERGMMLVLTGILLALSLFTLARIDVDESPLESHRFMTAAIFIVPVLGVLFMRNPTGRPARAAPYGHMVVSAGLLLGALSSLDWLYVICPGWANTHEHYYADIDHYELDCRETTGASLGSEARLHYLAKPVWYLYAGCVPTYALGKPAGSKWELTIGRPLFGAAAEPAIAELRQPGQELPVVCPIGTQTERMCKAAVAEGRCTQPGSLVQVCQLPPAPAP